MGMIASIQRGKTSYALVIPFLCISVTPAFGELLLRDGKVHGTTMVSIPSPICAVRLDSQGRLTGSCSKISVAHSDPGTFCAKVSSASVTTGGDGRFDIIGQPIQLNYCSFNIQFDTVGSLYASLEKETMKGQLSEWCRMNYGRNGGQASRQHPYFGLRYVVRLDYNNGDWYHEVYSPPPITVTCDPCPQLIAKGVVKLQANTQVSIPFTSLISGGVPPYTFLGWQNLPTGLSVDPAGNLIGRPVAQERPSGSQLTVMDSCGSGGKNVTNVIQIFVNEAPKILSFSATPTAFDSFGGNITASVKASDVVGVTETRIVITNPNGSQTAVPRIPLFYGSAQNGEWRYSWVLPGNTTSLPMVYGIQARVYDAEGEMTASQILSVTVPGKPASTLPLPSPTGLPRLR